MGYVYKYVFNGEVIYIGKTKSLSNRLSQHGCNGDNIDKKYWDEINASDIYVKAVDGDLATDLLETCLINQYTPKCNKAKVIEGYVDLGIEIKDANAGFSPYSPNGYCLRSGYTTPMQTRALVRELETLQDEHNNLWEEYNGLMDRYEILADECDVLKSKGRLTEEIKAGERNNERTQIASKINNALREVNLLQKRTVKNNQDAWMLQGEIRCLRRLLRDFAHIIPIECDLMDECKRGFLYDYCR